ncbi:MAG: gliding motility-associated ABC transporter substrate-binding protein GldG [Cryomorphaceae bacterium]|nr:gliding motility-associated ABC transporter substrate-binding protein GldG [Cryomorphaceae bacterium]
MKRNNQTFLIQIILWGAIIVLLNLVSQRLFFRADLTAEKRYSLNKVTKDLIAELEDPVLVKLYMAGEMPADFLRLQREAIQMLNEFKAIYKNIELEIIDPNAIENRKERSNLMQQLETLGLNPIQVEIEESGGEKRITVYPGAIMSYAERQIPVQLLSGQLNVTPEQQINAAIQNLEYTWANAIRSLAKTKRKSVGFLFGNGQLPVENVADIMTTLSQHYEVGRMDIKEYPVDTITGELSLQRQLTRINRFDAIVIAKPTEPFNNLDKFLIDQYIMQGGNVLWCIDAVHADMDSLSESSEMLAFPILDDLKISDMLFKYGVRVNSNLVQDLKAAWLSDMQRVRPWVYFPLVTPRVKHPITKDLNAIKLQFASSIDTVMAEGITKTPLLLSSGNTKVVPTPHVVSLDRYYNFPKDDIFAKSNIPMAYLLEGEFNSIFANRIMPRLDGKEDIPFREKGKHSTQVIIADGDVIKNQRNILNPNIERGKPLPLGLDQFTGVQYGNKDFLLNVFDYMLDPRNLIQIRSRELKIRLLDRERMRAERNFWVVINTAVPILLMVLIGIINIVLRKRKYA